MIRPRFVRNVTGSPLIALFLAIALIASACGSTNALTQVIEARRLAAELRVQFTKAVEASNRAVMADTDEASVAAAEEARRAREAAVRDVQALEPVLQSLGFNEDAKILDAFTSRFEEYRKVDDEVLALAVENSNLKAQQLSFGPARDAVGTFAVSLEAALKSAPPQDAWRARALGRQALVAALQIEVLQAPHIAERDDAVMQRIEEQMGEQEQAARDGLVQLQRALPTAASDLQAARAALDKLMSVNSEIVKLSRRNTNVRSLALSLGRKGTLAVECEASLRALDEAVAKHEFTATR
jgi:hypothetical protein